MKNNKAIFSVNNSQNKIKIDLNILHEVQYLFNLIQKAIDENKTFNIEYK